MLKVLGTAEAFRVPKVYCLCMNKQIGGILQGYSINEGKLNISFHDTMDGYCDGNEGRETVLMKE